jgi:hypothetical protein
MSRELAGALGTELRSIQPGGRRGTDALAAALSVALAALAALFLHSDEPWRAAISAWMITRSPLAAALSRGIMRIVGSAAGATIAVITLDLSPTTHRRFAFASSQWHGSDCSGLRNRVMATLG